jgi:amino acid transporter
VSRHFETRQTELTCFSYITVLSVLIWAINFWGARAYGEAEFWFSAIKVITIVGLIILGIVLMCGGGPSHDAIVSVSASI